jgi:hypothetical protein
MDRRAPLYVFVAPIRLVPDKRIERILDATTYGD